MAVVVGIERDKKKKKKKKKRKKIATSKEIGALGIAVSKATLVRKIGSRRNQA